MEEYNPLNVVQNMGLNLSHYIPDALINPHSEYCLLVKSQILLNEENVRVLFPYPDQEQKENTMYEIVDQIKEVQDDPLHTIETVHQFKMMKKHKALGFIMQSFKIEPRDVATLKRAGFRLCPLGSNEWNV